MTWVFGYGSLMNPKSAAKTIHRIPEGDGAIPGTVRGWKRKWQLVSTMMSLSGAPADIDAIVYLDVVPDEETAMNGLMIEVNEEELALFDLREVNYDRVDVTDHVTPTLEGPVYLYVAREPYTKVPERAGILQQYVDTVEEALRMWGEEFATQYHATTFPSDLPLIPGSYERKA